MNKIDKLEDINILIKKFLCCIPIKNIDFNILKNLLWEEQLSFLNATISSNLNKNFPIKVDYQRQFLKTVISTLESNGIEVHDSIYENYCDLLNKPSEKENFKHYICESDVITLKENNSFISEGTTGLCSWQAAFALSEWCLTNKSYLQNKNVLELGSGIGLLGIVLSKYCQCQSVTLTDCHPTVIKVLTENITLNFSPNNFSRQNAASEKSFYTKEQTNDNIVCEKNLKNCELDVKDSVGLQNEQFRIVKDLCGENVQHSDSKNSEVTLDFVESSINLSEKCVVDSIGKISRTFMECTGKLDLKCSDAQIQTQCETKLAHKNLNQNLGTEEEKSYQNLIFSDFFENTHVKVLNLPWQEIGNPDFYSGSPNVVLAADVVYDSTVFEPLSSAIKLYLKNDNNCELILACTERNKDTLKEFLDIIKSENLNLNELESEPSKVFFWNPESPIRIFRISS